MNQKVTQPIMPIFRASWAFRSLIIPILILLASSASAHDQRGDTLVSQATVLYRRGQAAEAIDKCKLALGLGERSDAAFVWGLALMKQKQYAEAVTLLERARGNQGARHPVRHELIQFALGKCHSELGNVEASVTAFSAATRLEPREPRYWEALAAALDKAGRTTDATLAREKAKGLIGKHTKK